MPMLHSLVPDSQILLELPVDELASVLFAYLSALSPKDQNWHRNNFFLASTYTFQGYPEDKHRELEDAFVEAWGWLEREGLILPYRDGWYRMTRRGRSLKTPGAFDAYRAASRFPRHLLHVALPESVWANFLRGSYDTAVFEAFKHVEVTTRAVAGLSDRDYGVTLMRKAFDKDAGQLRDRPAMEAEREATANLFAGAIGVFKNPHSHRKVVLADPAEAFEMLIVASQLLRIVEARSGDAE
jgi:uncharacterized protein (TIGR02391 family)